MNWLSLKCLFNNYIFLSCFFVSSTFLIASLFRILLSIFASQPFVENRTMRRFHLVLNKVGSFERVRSDRLITFQMCIILQNGDNPFLSFKVPTIKSFTAKLVRSSMFADIVVKLSSIGHLHSQAILLNSSAAQFACGFVGLGRLYE